MIVAVAAIIASAAGAFNDFVYDDLPLIRDNVRIHHVDWSVLFRTPYWPPPFVQQLYRPLTLLLLAVEYWLGGGSPLAFRLMSYLLYAACACGVYILAKALLPRRAAFAAALVFAVHPVHVEAVALGVGQAELIVGLCALGIVWIYVKARRTGGLGARHWMPIAALYVVAALSKENGLVLPALPLAAELTLVDSEPLAERISELAPGFLLMGVLAVSLVVQRSLVIGSAALAVVPSHAMAGLGVAGRLYEMLRIVPLWAERFVAPVHLQVDYIPPAHEAGASVALLRLVGIVLAVALPIATVKLRRAAPVFAFGVLWCGIGLLPVSNIIPTGVVLAERTLFLPSIGVVLAGAAAVELALQRWNSTRTREFAVTALLVLIALGVVRSASRQHVWNSEHLTVVPQPATPQRNNGDD